MEELTQAEKFSSYVFERFGIPIPDSVKIEGKSNLRMMSSELKEFPTLTPKGISAANMNGIFPKPSTSFLQLFGNLATKNTIELEKADALKFATRQNIETKQDAETGYVILKYNGAVLGCGFYKEGKIENLFPKQRKIRVT
jgi:NOL1/NOP2/fmu family ribosome biogenesis protein